MTLVIGIVSIATRDYIYYWEKMVLSSAKLDATQVVFKFYVFTDQIKEVTEFVARNTFDVEFVKIDALGWPEATLLRYSIIHEHRHLFEEDVLMYLDADMLLMKEFESEIYEELDKSEMFLVQHPGYYRPSGFRKIQFYFSNTSMLIRDVRMLVQVGALGSWENFKLSKAYVPRYKRKSYYCGGIWFGEKSLFLEFCGLLQSRVKDDLDSNIIAIWHDESHLNWWAANNSFRALPPKYCFDPTYKQLSGLNEIVRAVDKSSQEII
jgi:hypothetical protein